MPIPGLSLHGFMTEVEAVNWLTQACVLNGTPPSNLWATALARLGAPFPNAGQPDIQDLPPSCGAYIAQLETQPWFQHHFGAGTYAFKLVEIEPLLSYQFTVSDGHAQSLTAPLASGVDVQSLLPLALPQSLTPATAVPSMQGTNSLVLMSSDLNFTVFGMGQEIFSQMPGWGVVGPLIGTRPPVVQVGEFNGRYYLRNGYHRVTGAASYGATHIPCVVMHFDSYEELTGPVAVFNQTLMESNAPPTMGHYTQGRATANSGRCRPS